MEKVLFIINAHAGKQEIYNYLVDILELFSKHNIIPQVYITQSPNDGYQKVISDGHMFDVILCSGGDGTLDEVVTGVVDASLDVVLGYIPAGSTNDFAHSLEIPLHMMEAASIIVENHQEKIDLGQFNDNHFVYVAAFGAFTDVSYKTSQNLKNVLGQFAYLIEGAKRLPGIRPLHLKVTVDDKEYEGDYIYGMVSNSMYVAGVKNAPGKDIELSDGLFEMVLIHKIETPFDIQDMIDGLTRKECNDITLFVKGKNFTFTFDEEVAWTLDGEDGGSHKEVTIVNIPERLNIIVRDV